VPAHHPLHLASCDPATAKRTRGKGAKGGRAAASLAARPAQAVAAPLPFPPPSAQFSAPFLRTAVETCANGSQGGAGGDNLPPAGGVIEFLTSHCDPTVNLHASYLVVDGDAIIDCSPIVARGYGVWMSGGNPAMTKAHSPTHPEAPRFACAVANTKILARLLRCLLSWFDEVYC